MFHKWVYVRAEIIMLIMYNNCILQFAYFWVLFKSQQIELSNIYRGKCIDAHIVLLNCEFLDQPLNNSQGFQRDGKSLKNHGIEKSPKSFFFSDFELYFMYMYQSAFAARCKLGPNALCYRGERQVFTVLPWILTYNLDLEFQPWLPHQEIWLKHVGQTVKLWEHWQLDNHEITFWDFTGHYDFIWSKISYIPQHNKVHICSCKRRHISLSNLVLWYMTQNLKYEKINIKLGGPVTLEFYLTFTIIIVREFLQVIEMMLLYFKTLSQQKKRMYNRGFLTIHQTICKWTTVTFWKQDPILFSKDSVLWHIIFHEVLECFYFLVVLQICFFFVLKV